MLVYQRVTYQVFFLWDLNGDFPWDLTPKKHDKNGIIWLRGGVLGYLSGEIGRCCFDIQLSCC